ncbi:MAG TPA: FixH family protein [Bryobacteraceae bacterium]
MKAVALLLLGAGLVLAQEPREGNFIIRFEPKAVLQTEAPIPFQVDVSNALHKPLIQAKVTLQIETAEHMNVKVFDARAVSPGVYIAKPVFPDAGQWNVYVEVKRGDATSARTIQFYVPESAQ